MKSVGHMFRVRNEKGVALIVVLVLSAVALAVMAGLLYIVLSRTQISGLQKRYKTALEAGFGGVDIAYQFISLRGDSSSQSAFVAELTSFGINPVVSGLFVTTPASCTRSSSVACGDLPEYTGLEAKLNLPTSCWAGCSDTQNLNANDNTTFDIAFQLPGSGTAYNVYAKVVDTVLGNSGAGENLIAHGVTDPRQGERVRLPYMYTLEVEAGNANQPLESRERAKLSILYEY